MVINTKEQFLAQVPEDYVEVEIKGLNDKIRLKSLSGTERNGLVGKVDAQGNPVGDFDPMKLQLKLLVKCIVDENGKRIFDDADTSVVEALPAKVLDRLTHEASRLNGLDDAAINNQVQNLD